MSSAEIASLIASVVSVTLAIVAMGLAGFFYKLTKDEAARNTEAAARIEQSTGQLSTWFNRMYSDTFSLMREQFHGMQSQVFQQPTTGRDGNEAAQAQADQQIEELKQLTDARITQILEQMQIADANLDTVREELTAVANTTIEQSRRVDANVKRDVVRAAILDTLRTMPNMQMESGDLIGKLFQQHGARAVHNQIIEMSRGTIPTLGGLPPSASSLIGNEVIRIID